MRILSRICPADYEPLYGEKNGGIGYCSFKYTLDKVYWKGASVRTSKTDYIKVNPAFLLTNRDRCELHDIDHELMLGFYWDTQCSSIFIIPDKNIDNARSSISENYWIFKKSSLEGQNGITKLV